MVEYEEGRHKDNPGKYADTSIFCMLDEIVEMGGRKHALKAKIVGGAQMFSYLSSSTLDIGGRNSKTAIETLQKEKIPLVVKDVGGTVGRTVAFDLSTGILSVRTGKSPAVEM